VQWAPSAIWPGFRRRARTGALAITDQGVVSASSLLTSVIVARACGQDAFGIFVLGMSVVLLVLELQGALVSTPYLVNAPALSGGEAQRYGGSALLHNLGLAVVVSAGLALATVVLTSGDSRLSLVGWALVLGAPFITLRDFLRRHCFARLRFGSALLMDLGVGVFQVGGLGALAAAAWLSPSLALATVATASGIGALIWLRANHGDFSPRFRDARADARRHWSVGRWVFASQVLWAAAAQFYPWLLAALRAAADVAVWGAAMGIAAVLNVPLLAGANVLSPSIARARTSRDPWAFFRFVLWVSAGFAAVVLCAALPLLLFGGWLLGLVYGITYTDCGGVVTLIAAGMVFLAASFGISRGLFCLDRADLDFRVNLAPFAVLLFLGPSLVRGWGALGAAFAQSTAHAVSAALRVIALVYATSRAAEARPS